MKSYLERSSTPCKTSSTGTFVSFDIVSLFTNVPVEEVLLIIRNRLRTDPSFPEHPPLQFEDVMELLDICFKTIYFQYYQQKEGVAMGNSLSPVLSNIFMEHFEEIAMDTAECKPANWLMYVNDTFVIWPYGPENLQEFLQHINNI
jgi:hypothetical protein